MVNIQVFGQQELVEHIKDGKEIYSHCISITNPEALSKDDPQCKIPDELESSFMKVLRLKFWDENDTANLGKIENKKLIEREDVETILQFVQQTRDVATGYTIHCWRGISRSTSIALGILQYILNDEIAASDKLIEIRRNAMPLKRSVQLFDEVLGSNLADFRNTVYKFRMRAMREEMNRLQLY